MGKIFHSIFQLFFTTGALFYLVTLGPPAGYAQPTQDSPQSFSSLDALLNSKNCPKQCYVSVEGFYIESFEENIFVNDIVENRDGSFFAEGEIAWISWGVKRPGKQLSQNLKTYQPVTDEEPVRFGKVRVIGAFSKGGEFGHLGQYQNLLVIKEIYLFATGQWLVNGDKN